MDSIYLVVWSGGYEAPSYAAFHDEDEARAKAAEWAQEMDEDEGDCVDLLKIQPVMGNPFFMDVVRLVSK